MTGIMRAVEFDHFGDADVLELRDVPVPEPISTEIRVRCVASSLNPVDVKTRRGQGVARWQGTPPYRLGWDVAGVVDAAGYGVTRFEVGDTVYGMPWFPRRAGADAQFVTAPSLHFAPAPRSLSLREAAGLPLAALTAWQSLEGVGATAMRPTVLVTGATGGVGHLAVQMAKCRGARVVAVSRAAPARVFELTGADEVARDPGEVEPASVDVVLDLVGATWTAKLLRVLHRGGVLAAVAEGAPDEVKAEARRRGIRVVEPLVEPNGHALEEIARLTDAGTLHLTVDRAFDLAQVREAHRYLESRIHARGKVLLAID